MARKLFIAGNWKMNTTRSSAVALASELKASIGSIDTVDMAVIPPSVYLSAVSEVLEGDSIAVGAQNMYFEQKGAFTGETSAAMLKDIGCKYVLLGHSERRHVFGETDELINKKVLKALEEGLDVIFAVGELLQQREAGETTQVVTRQITDGLVGVDAAGSANITIAYEPVWAIGTGKTATPEQAQEVHAMIRGLVCDLYDAATAEAMRIQYGGSVTPDNAANLLARKDVDGALVGGASLKSEDFAAIVKAGL